MNEDIYFYSEGFREMSRGIPGDVPGDSGTFREIPGHSGSKSGRCPGDQRPGAMSRISPGHLPGSPGLEKQVPPP